MVACSICVGSFDEISEIAVSLQNGNAQPDNCFK